MAEIKKNNTTLSSYKGKIDYAIKQKLISDVVKASGLSEKSTVFKKKTRYVLDECITNIIHYYHEQNLDLPFGLKISHSKEATTFTLSNYILPKDLTNLKKRILEINASDEDQKKLLINNTLKNNLDLNKPGAGLGLLTLKKKLGTELKFAVRNGMKGMKIFYLSVKLNG